MSAKKTTGKDLFLDFYFNLLAEFQPVWPWSPTNSRKYLYCKHHYIFLSKDRNGQTFKLFDLHPWARLRDWKMSLLNLETVVKLKDKEAVSESRAWTIWSSLQTRTCQLNGSCDSSKGMSPLPPKEGRHAPTHPLKEARPQLTVSRQDSLDAGRPSWKGQTVEFEMALFW